MTDTAEHPSEPGGLLPCPFCGGKAEVVEIEEGENAGGSCVSCTQCQASSNVEFEFKENFCSNWNSRTAAPKATEGLTAESIVDSPRVLGVYAAPEWAELSEDGKAWVRALVAETQASAAAEAEGLTAEDQRALRAGRHLFERARGVGWPDDGEGAAEFWSRRSYEVGHEDGRAARRAAQSPEPPASPAGAEQDRERGKEGRGQATPPLTQQGAATPGSGESRGEAPAGYVAEPQVASDTGSHAPPTLTTPPADAGGDGELTAALVTALKGARHALHNLKAIVEGEAPGLLDEDSGGSAFQTQEIEDALSDADAALAAARRAHTEDAAKGEALRASLLEHARHARDEGVCLTIEHGDLSDFIRTIAPADDLLIAAQAVCNALTQDASGAWLLSGDDPEVLASNLAAALAPTVEEGGE